MTKDDNDRLRSGEDMDPAAGTVDLEVPTSDPYLVVARGFWFIREPSGRWCQVAKEAAAIDLNRMYPALRLFRETESGEQKQLSPIGVYERYGRRADDVTYEMGGSGRYVERGAGLGGELVIGCCRMLPIAPRFHPEIDDWLALLGSAQASRLLDWLATCHLLDRPTAALYLRGDPGCGKTMLAMSIAAMWGPHLTSYKDVVIGQYSGALVRSPVVILDERAPEDRTGNASGAFRELVGNNLRPLTEKYAPSSTIRGCPRLIIAANDDDALRLSPEDQRRADDAIGVRILHIVCSPSARTYLDELGNHTTTGDWVTRDGGPGKIAEHIRWIQENWTVQQPGRRFLVEGDPAIWTQSVAARRGLPQRILVAVARVLAGAVRTDREVCWEHLEGATTVIAVSVRPLRESWADVAGEDAQHRPSEQQIAAALERIGLPPEGSDRKERTCRRRVPRGGSRSWVYVIGIPMILEAVQNTGVVMVDELPPCFQPGHTVRPQENSGTFTESVDRW